MRGEQNWEESDLVLNGLRDRGIPVVVGLVGSPRWANGGRTPNFAPGATTFAAFARTAASRYRWVVQWLVWNEPNQARWLRPTTPAVYVRQLLNPAYKAIHAANPRAKVGGGVTAPRGSTAGVSPVNWIRGMRKAECAARRVRTPSVSVDEPRDAVRRRQLQVLHHDHDGHARAIALGGRSRAFGPKRIWLTEYGYQTGAFGVTQQRQAELIGQSGMRVQKAPRVDMLIHYLVKDEPETARFQSGLFQNSGRPKLAALAFPFPIAQAGRSGGNLVLWGQIRPRAGAQTYRVQVRSHRRVALQRRCAQDDRSRLLQHRCRRRAGRPCADLLPAGRGVQHHDPRSLNGHCTPGG